MALPAAAVEGQELVELVGETLIGSVVLLKGSILRTGWSRFGSVLDGVVLLRKYILLILTGTGWSRFGLVLGRLISLGQVEIFRQERSSSGTFMHTLSVPS